MRRIRIQNACFRLRGRAEKPRGQLMIDIILFYKGYLHIVAKTTKGHESENLLLQQISEKQVNTPVDSCVNCAQINESSHPVTKHNSVTKHEAKQSHLHQVGLKQLSNNSKSVNDVINIKGLSGKLNPDTVNNKQNYGHPSTSQKITHRSVNGENRVTTVYPIICKSILSLARLGHL